MSDLDSPDDKHGSALLSTASDQRQWAAIAGQRQLESENMSGNDGGPPTAQATVPKQFDRDSEKASEAGLLSREEVSRGVDESFRPKPKEGAKNQQRFHLAYEKYFSESALVDDLSAVKGALFSSSIIAADKSNRDFHRPEECKEYQHRCWTTENFASNRIAAASCLASSTRKQETTAGVMPATCALDPGRTASKLTNLSATFSVPPSPQRSSSSNSDGGSSTFVTMAKRLHRLRLAATAPTRGCNDDLVASTRESANEEFVSIEPLTSAQKFQSTVKNTDGDQMPQISVPCQIDHRSAAVAESEYHGLYRSYTPSAGPSLSDISAVSFYRLPAKQVQTSDGLQRPAPLSSPFGASKVWSSEPVLAAQFEAAVGKPGIDSGRYSGSNGYDSKNGRSRLTSAEERRKNSSTQPRQAKTLTERLTEMMNSLQRDCPGGATIDSDCPQDRHSPVVDSHRYSTFPWEYSPAADLLDANAGNASSVTGAVRRSHAGAPKEAGTFPTGSLPPLPPVLMGSTNDPHPPSVNHDTPASHEARNGGRNKTTTQALPDSISRLMDAVSRHPTGDLDYAKLRTILRDQRKLYKRRLERERAKREALEDLLLKLNSSHLQHRSFSNASSIVSTGRNAAGENGRSMTNLGDVVTLRSSSVDANAAALADATLVKLIQRHLRVNRAMPGHRGKHTTDSSSTSGEERDGVDQRTVRSNRPRDLKQAHLFNGLEDEIPMGGEAASGTMPPDNLLNGKVADNSGFYLDASRSEKSATVPKSKSFEHPNAADGRPNQAHGLIDKEALKLVLDNNSSTGGSENDRRSSSSERRKQRKRWETHSSEKDGKGVERDQGHTARTASSRRQDSATTTPRPSVAFFVSAEVKKPEEAQNGLRDLKSVKPLQYIFRERQSKFIQRSICRQNKIKAASELRAETARRIRELADDVAHGRMRMEEANERLLLFELPQPSAFSRSEMFKASKMKYEQLPEMIARRHKLKTEADRATNRVMAKMFKQKLDFKRLLKKAGKRGLDSSFPSVVASNRPPSVRLLNR